MGNSGVKKLIFEVKKGNIDEFLNILKLFEPAINKYTNKMYLDDKEDVHSELVLGLLEATLKINYCNEEGQCIVFLSNALKFKFYEIYKKSISKNSSEYYFDNFNSLIIDEYEFEKVLLKLFFEEYIRSQGTNFKDIIYMILIENKTDKEISTIKGVSRQYVNKLRIRIKAELKDIITQS